MVLLIPFMVMLNLGFHFSLLCFASVCCTPLSALLVGRWHKQFRTKIKIKDNVLRSILQLFDMTWGTHTKKEYNRPFLPPLQKM